MRSAQSRIAMPKAASCWKTASRQAENSPELNSAAHVRGLLARGFSAEVG
jgi:hypothetical protein